MAADAAPSPVLNLPFAEQIAFFLRKLNLPTERWDDIRKAAHDRAFVVAGAMKADLVNDLRQAVAPLQRTTQREFNEAFRGIVQARGWHGWTGEGTKSGEAWRTRVIFETNVRASYAAGRYQQLTDPVMLAERPYWRYVHSGRAKDPRPEHVHWSAIGLTLPHDHPFWTTHAPPNDFGCGCYIVAERAPADGAATAPPAGWDAIDPKTGAPRGIGKGWDYAPGANAATPLADLVADKLVRLEAPIGAAMWEQLAPVVAMERELAWWQTLDAWLADTHPRGKTAVVGALTPRTLVWLAEHGKPLPPTAEIGIRDNLPRGRKQARHSAAGDGLTREEWRALPALLERPAAIYWDVRADKLVFVADGRGPTKAVVEFAPTVARSKDAGMNLIVTAFRVSDVDIEANVKGGKWEIVEVPGSRVGVEPT